MPKHHGEAAFVAYVLDQIAELKPDSRAMFGGTALSSGGANFGMILKGHVYFKVDGESKRDYEEAGMAPFRPDPRWKQTSYYEVPPDVLDDRPTLVEWARRAVRAARG